MSILKKYLKDIEIDNINTGLVAYLANLEKVQEVSKEAANGIVKELINQRENLKLIASENFSSLSVQSTMGNLLTDKYAEGFPYHRFYAGCENVDYIEDLAAKEACDIFGAEYAYVQPHSGADANLVAYWGILRSKIQVPELEKLGQKNPLKLSKEDWNDLRFKLGNQKLLGLGLYSGGHLTHGYRLNVSSQIFDAYEYNVDPQSGLLDYDNIEKIAKDIRPLILLAGYSAYTRKIDFEKLRRIADDINAVLMVDMAHFAGLVAGGVFEDNYNPVKYADVVTSTTHKTLRGPRGGIVLCKNKYAESMAKGCPMVLGGPLPHVMAAKLVAFKEANTKEYREYTRKVVENSHYLASELLNNDISVLTKGTDNHIVLVDVYNLGITGRQGESSLRECSMTLNRNTVPSDKNGPWYTSGLRFGTSSVTTLGMGKDEMKEIAQIISLVLKNTRPTATKESKISKSKYTIADDIRDEAKRRVARLLSKFILYPELKIEYLKNFLL
jgi:glycine hydroxymethyltransferase